MPFVPRPSRRSFLEYLLAPAALSGASLVTGRATARSAGPELVGINGWVNTDVPLTVAGLRGKVVLIEFCTYTCINWRRTLPYVNRWNAEYGPQGLQIIGVHAPEFSFERILPYVESAMQMLHVRFPIAQDNGFQTWRTCANDAWPSFYLLDRDGRVRLVRVGEGHSQEVEGAIRHLLGLEAGSGNSRAEDADLSRIGTPEMYFGSWHPTPQDPAQSPRLGEGAYAFGEPSRLKLNEYQLDGTWARGDEPLVLRSPNGRVCVRFSAAKLHLIAGAPRPAPVRVSVDGGPERVVEIGTPTLYTLLDGDRYSEHVLELACATPGLSLFSATFS